MMDKIIKNKLFLLLLIGGLLFIVLRIPSLFEPHWYGDEGIYAAVGEEMSHGEMLYKDIWDNKPHAIYVVYMLAGRTNRLFFIRLFNLIAGLLTIYGIFKLTKKILNKSVASLAFFLTIILLGSPMYEGNIANGENFFLPFIVWGIYFGFDSLVNTKKQMLAGIFFGIATLFKIIALLDFAALVVYLAAAKTPLFSKKFRIKDLTKLLPAIIGFCIPIFLVSSYEVLNHNFINFVNATLLDMFAYVSYSGEDTLGLVFIKLTNPIKILILMLANIIILLNFFKKHISKQGLLIALVLLFEYFATITSDRHYIHYLLQLIPGFALISALTLKHIQEKKYLIDKINICVIFLLGTYLALINFTQGRGLETNYAAWKFQDKQPIFKTYAYYENFVNYKILNRISKEDYNGFFNDEETKIILLERTLDSVYKEMPKDKIYIYTDRAWTYPYLNIRVPTSFSVAYHRYISEDGDEILINELESFDPELIVVENGVGTFDAFDSLLLNSYELKLQDQTYSYYSKICD